jgi:hypothetical protein
MLLDRAPTARGNGSDGNSGHGTTFTAASHAGVSNERIAAAERVLHVLDAMPTNDPSADLVQRTMARIESGAAASMGGQGAPPLIDMTRPVA